MTYFGKAGSAVGGTNVALGASGRVSVNSASATSTMAVDVTGYFVASIHAVVNNSGPIESASPRVISSQNLEPGYYKVDIDRALQGCTAVASIDGGPYVGAAHIIDNAHCHRHR